MPIIYFHCCHSEAWCGDWSPQIARFILSHDYGVESIFDYVIINVFIYWEAMWLIASLMCDWCNTLDCSIQNNFERFNHAGAQKFLIFQQHLSMHVIAWELKSRQVVSNIIWKELQMTCIYSSKFGSKFIQLCNKNYYNFQQSVSNLWTL